MTPTQTLFIWDFDNTVVLDNTDTLVFEKLAPQILESHRAHVRTEPGPHLWTTLIANGLTSLFEIGKTPAEILSAAAEAPLPADTASALLAIASSPVARSLVLSDANSLFIQACLDKARLPQNDIFEAGVITNPAYIEESGNITLHPFISPHDPDKAHKCLRCPANLCKGEVLQRLVADEYQGWRVVYVGDGGNDYCPVIRMQEDGVVLVRKGFPLHKKIINAPPKASVRVWETPQDLRRFVNELI